MTKARKVSTAIVRLWDQDVGAVAWDDRRGLGSFQYTQEFARRGLEVSPITMPLDPSRIYAFPALNLETFRGLPGLLADALPDRYGNALIDIWLRQHGRNATDFSPVERLCYMSTRAMGALEFKPAIGPRDRKSVHIEVAQLADLAAEVLQARQKLSVNLSHAKDEALKTIIRVGTSAGGARAKAVIAWNPKTHEVRSGQVVAPAGFEAWLLKFDGANALTLGDPAGFGRIEYAYHRMAVAAKIEMAECRLFEEGGRAHFMTRRFDRAADGKKIHMQSLCAMGHYDFNAPGQFSYEQALGVIQKLNLGHRAMQQQFRRMVFNVLARNQDDHTRNIAFLMDEAGRWRLAPAFDVIWSFNPKGGWTNQHQMRINGKHDHFTMSDLTSVATQYGISNAQQVIAEIRDAVSRWPKFAADAGVDKGMVKQIRGTHRLKLVT